MSSGVGRICRILPFQRRGWPRTVKYTSWPTLTRTMSASDTCAQTVMGVKSAIRRMVGASHVVVGAGDVTVVAGNDRLGKKFLVAVAQHLSKRKLRLLEGALRGHVLQGCVGRGERGVRQNRVDFGEQLVDYHLVSAFDLERFQLAGGLSAHID